jgi:hypothetical protein
MRQSEAWRRVESSEAFSTGGLRAAWQTGGQGYAVVHPTCYVKIFHATKLGCFIAKYLPLMVWFQMPKHLTLFLLLYQRRIERFIGKRF